MFRLLRSLLVPLVCASVCTSSCTSKSETSADPGDANATIAQPLLGSPNDSNRVSPTPSVDSNQAAVAVGPNVVFVGRTVTWNGNQTVLSWPGSQVIGGFTGSSIGALITPADQASYPGLGSVNNFIDVAIDGNATGAVEITQGTSRVMLASNLGAGTHTVTITKRTESQLGSLLFSGFIYATGGGPAPTAARPKRRIEFIGDSGTVGYGANGNFARGDKSCSFTAQTEDATHSYPLIASAQLQAEPHVIGGSGKGIYKNRDGINDSVETLPVMWTYTIGDRQFSQPDWQPTSWVADAVVVNLGGNDFTTTDGSSYSVPSATSFATKANAFMKQLRVAYPNAWLFVITSPMLDEDLRPSAEAYAQAMAASVSDGRAAYLPLLYDDGSRNYGCDYHMTVATHRLVGQTLARAMAAKVGW